MRFFADAQNDKNGLGRVIKLDSGGVTKLSYGRVAKLDSGGVTKLGYGYIDRDIKSKEFYAYNTLPW